MAAKEFPTVLATSTSRRELLKKAAYVTPVVLTLTATPAFAKNGSNKGPTARPSKGGKKSGTYTAH